MASNGLLQKAKTGTCRVCLRARNTDKYLNIVGEVRHGFATGNIWQCKNSKECVDAAKDKIAKNHIHKSKVEISLLKYLKCQ